MQLKFLLISIFLLQFLVVDTSLRNKRFLIFPQQAPTRHQFIAGIGIPADLELESVVEGYVLKAEFWLPYNSTVWRQNPFPLEYKTRHQRSPLRWNLYEILADRMNRYGLNGVECVRKAICEANNVNFAHEMDVFAHLAHIFFSPSTSNDINWPGSWDYQAAERHGKEGLSCEIYNCKKSLLNLISSVFHTNY